MHRRTAGVATSMQPLAIGAGIAFAALGVLAERLASVWPSDEARRRAPGARTALLALAAGGAGAGIAARSSLPPWATAVYLALVALMVLLTATDLEQRRLPHLLLDPLVIGALLFVPFNPAVVPLSALGAAAGAVAFLGALAVLVRGGLALGDLYLVTPIGLMLGWPAIFVAIFVAALLAAATSVLLLLARRVGLKSYLPFGPFLVAGAIVAMLTDPDLLVGAAAAAVVVR